MAEAVSLQVVFKLIGTMTQVADLSFPADVLNVDYSKMFSSGTGASQLNMWWHDQRTIAPSSTENLDLAGSLVSTFGTTITMTSLKGMFVYAATANTNSVQVQYHPTNGVPFMMAVSDGMALKPGMWWAWFDPSANGAIVTPTTGDLIAFTNSGAGTSVTYDVFLFGEV